jgi:hypothetical protein
MYLVDANILVYAADPGAMVDQLALEQVEALYVPAT